MRKSVSSDHVVSSLGAAHWATGFLALGKALFVFGIISLYSSLLGLPILQVLFTTKSIAAVCLVAIQKPFAGQPLSRSLQIRIVRRCVAGIGLSILWLYGLTLCGPLRTVLLYGQLDAVPVAVLVTIFSGNRTPSRLRGAVFFVLAVLALLLFDNDVSDVPDGSGQRVGLPLLASHLLGTLAVADHKGGVVLLLLCVALRITYNNAGRKLSVEVGGAKRLQTVTTLGEATLLLPLALLSCFIQESQVESVTSYVPTLVMLALMLYVVDFYVESISANRLDGSQLARVACLVQTSLALTLSWLSQSGAVDGSDQPHHGLSAGVIASALLFMAATFALTSSGSGGRGQLVGFSAGGLPLYSLSSSLLPQGSVSAMAAIRMALRRVRADPNSKRIFYLLLLNGGFMLVEFAYGVWTNSLSLISDGFHMLFDCSALAMGLAASVIAQWKPSKQFSYGYGRVEVLSGFVNALFLLVVAYMVFMEAVSRLLDPPDIKTDRLLTVSVLGLLVNVAGLLVFGGAHGHSHGAGGAHGHSHSPNANLRGVWLHLVADTLGSLGVLVSALLVRHAGWLAADPVCSALIAVLIVVSVLPLLRQTALVLVLRAPAGRDRQLREALDKVLLLEGVQSYSDPHFWSHSADHWVGTLHVQVKETASEQTIIGQVTSVFRQLGFSTFAVQVEKPEFVSKKSSQYSGYGLGLVDRATMFDPTDGLSAVKSI
ncbi:zinc transporter 5-like [Amphibalanus amphitrite]|uniref:zinc transporter 5-like n=1 Tax=Amphibalanus amphitrite TaxID=1232801 RepID=UPI001C91EE60|nr:zinc transporter 5-like [Amphibalanus amphitrite]